MNNEIREAKIKWNKELSEVIYKIAKEHQPDEACKNCKQDDPMFNTSCQMYTLISKLYELSDTLRGMTKFSEYLL